MAMSSEIVGKTFEMLSDAEVANALEGVVLRKCHFKACHLGATARRAAERRIIRNVTLVDCKATTNSSLGPVLVEDTEVDSLATTGVCMAWGAAFKHVALRGKCGKLVLNLPRPNERAEAFRKANDEYYSRVDWALDISRGEFEELELRGVPADLVRRDPSTQAVVRLETVARMQSTWEKLDLAGTPWPLALRDILRWNVKDEVLVAPKRSKNFQHWLAGLELLRHAGVAE